MTEEYSSGRRDVRCGDSQPPVQPKVGIALGAGGARGIAHIPMLEARRTDIYIKPRLADFRTLQFNRVDKIYSEAQTAKEELKHELKRRLAARNAAP